MDHQLDRHQNCQFPLDRGREVVHSMCLTIVYHSSLHHTIACIFHMDSLLLLKNIHILADWVLFSKFNNIHQGLMQHFLIEWGVGGTFVCGSTNCSCEVSYPKIHLSVPFMMYA